MIFLVGVPRSGTNWLQRLLALHPDVVALPAETHLFSEGIRHLQDRVQHGLVRSPATGTVFMERQAFLRAARAFCDAAYGGVAAALDPVARLVLERTPSHVYHLDLLGAVYPDAHYVHIVRDGRDVVRSQLAQSWGPSTLAEAARQWAEGVAGARAAGRDLAFYHEVRYEDLLADPRIGVHAVLGFLGLAAGPAVMDQILGEAGVAYNEDPGAPAVGAAKWRTGWSAQDCATFVAAAGGVLAELGYDVTLGPVARAAERRGVRHRLPAAARRWRVRRPRAGQRSDLQERFGLAQQTVDRFCAAVRQGDTAAALSRLAPAAKVRVVTDGGDRTAFGPDAAALLGEQLRRDRALGPVLHDACTVSGENFAVVLSQVGPSGTSVDRFLMFRVNGDAIEQLWYHRFPLRGAPAGRHTTRESWPSQ